MFIDITAAFYSILPEVVLGEFLASGTRLEALLAAGLLPAEVAEFEKEIIRGGPVS